mmetsp:Transcript_7191/g.26444  ORF Transcript_7191/g.26444 Transcript_7191/m.26444 type:complete len:127 (-) Transcript_7191:116-496(-)
MYRALQRSFASLPRVTEKMVAYTAIDQKGVRHQLLGLEGASVVEGLQATGYMPVVMSSKQGPDMHVTVANEWLQELPQMSAQEATHLAALASNPGPNSRLASFLTLRPELNGLVVAVAPMKSDKPV